MRDYWGEEREEKEEDDQASFCDLALECSPEGCQRYWTCIDREP